jgi:long-chain acyl-CoA synthetase
MAVNPSVDLAPIFQRAADERDHVAIADPAGVWSWSDAASAAARIASALTALPLPHDQRIAVLGENDAATLLFYSGALLAGFGTIMLNQYLTVPEIAYILEDGEARAIWADAGRASLARDAVVGLSDVILIGPDDATWQRAINGASTTPPALDLPTTTDLGYTSGTTGRPKGVTVPKEPVATVRDRLGLAARHHSVGLGPHLVSGPLYHGGPHAAVGLLLMGTPTILIGKFDAREALAAIDRYRVASSVLVPTHLSRLLQLEEAERMSYDTSSLRLIVHTGSPCPPSVKRAVIDWFGPIVRETYGGIESGPIASISTEEWLAHPGSTGRAVWPYEIVVMREDGTECAIDEVGLVFARDETGEGISYRNDPEKTAAAHLAPSLFTLGDYGRLDAEGYLYLTSRRHDLVLSGGVNVYPAEAESILLEHPSVVDAACYGIADADLGERLVGVVVVSANDVTVEDVLTFCVRRLARHKTPRELHIVGEIKRNHMGKVDRRRLRAEHASTTVTRRGSGL